MCVYVVVIKWQLGDVTEMTKRETRDAIIRRLNRYNCRGQCPEMAINISYTVCMRSENRKTSLSIKIIDRRLAKIFISSRQSDCSRKQSLKNIKNLEHFCSYLFCSLTLSGSNLLVIRLILIVLFSFYFLLVVD